MKKTLLHVGGLLAVAAAALTLTACSAAAASAEGTWGITDTRGEPSLEFRPGSEGSGTGDVSGNDGCNTIGGSYTEQDGTIEFGLLHSTMMFCDGVDTWLSQAHTATIDGTTLTVLNEAGDEIGTLQRADDTK